MHRKPVCLLSSNDFGDYSADKEECQSAPDGCLSILRESRSHPIQAGHEGEEYVSCEGHGCSRTAGHVRSLPVREQL